MRSARLLWMLYSLVMLQGILGDSSPDSRAEILIRHPGEPGSKPFPGFTPEPLPSDHRLSPVQQSKGALSFVNSDNFRRREKIGRRPILKRRKVKKLRFRKKPDEKVEAVNEIEETTEPGTSLAPEASRGQILSELALTDQTPKGDVSAEKILPKSRTRNLKVVQSEDNAENNNVIDDVIRDNEIQVDERKKEPERRFPHFSKNDSRTRLPSRLGSRGGSRLPTRRGRGRGSSRSQSTRTPASLQREKESSRKTALEASRTTETALRTTATPVRTTAFPRRTTAVRTRTTAFPRRTTAKPSRTTATTANTPARQTVLPERTTAVPERTTAVTDRTTTSLPVGRTTKQSFGTSEFPNFPLQRERKPRVQLPSVTEVFASNAVSLEQAQKEDDFSHAPIQVFAAVPNRQIGTTVIAEEEELQPVIPAFRDVVRPQQPAVINPPGVVGLAQPPTPAEESARGQAQFPNLIEEPAVVTAQRPKPTPFQGLPISVVTQPTPQQSFGSTAGNSQPSTVLFSTTVQPNLVQPLTSPVPSGFIVQTIHQSTPPPAPFSNAAPLQDVQSPQPPVREPHHHPVNPSQPLLIPQVNGNIQHTEVASPQNSVLQPAVVHHPIPHQADHHPIPHPRPPVQSSTALPVFENFPIDSISHNEINQQRDFIPVFHEIAGQQQSEDFRRQPELSTPKELVQVPLSPVGLPVLLANQNTVHGANVRFPSEPVVHHQSFPHPQPVRPPQESFAPHPVLPSPHQPVNLPDLTPPLQSFQFQPKAPAPGHQVHPVHHQSQSVHLPIQSHPVPQNNPPPPPPVEPFRARPVHSNYQDHPKFNVPRPPLHIQEHYRPTPTSASIRPHPKLFNPKANGHFPPLAPLVFPDEKPVFRHTTPSPIQLSTPHFPGHHVHPTTVSPFRFTPRSPKTLPILNPRVPEHSNYIFNPKPHPKILAKEPNPAGKTVNKLRASHLPTRPPSLSFLPSSPSSPATPTPTPAPLVGQPSPTAVTVQRFPSPSPIPLIYQPKGPRAPLKPFVHLSSTERPRGLALSGSGPVHPSRKPVFAASHQLPSAYPDAVHQPPTTPLPVFNPRHQLHHSTTTLKPAGFHHHSPATPTPGFHPSHLLHNPTTPQPFFNPSPQLHHLKNVQPNHVIHPSTPAPLYQSYHPTSPEPRHLPTGPQPVYHPTTPQPVYHPTTPQPVYHPTTPQPIYLPTTPQPVYHPTTPQPLYHPTTPQPRKYSSPESRYQSTIRPATKSTPPPLAVASPAAKADNVQVKNHSTPPPPTTVLHTLPPLQHPPFSPSPQPVYSQTPFVYTASTRTPRYIESSASSQSLSLADSKGSSEDLKKLVRGIINGHGLPPHLDVGAYSR